MTKAEQDASYLVDPNLKSEKSAAPHAGPAAKLSPVLEPAAPVDTSNSTHVNTDPDGLEFSESAFLAEALDDGDCGVWMAATSNTNGLDFNAPGAPEIPAPDNFSSSSEEPPYIPDFGECMFCHAGGFVHDTCNECDSMFYPLSASPPDDDSSGIPEKQEEHDPTLNHVCRAMMTSFNTDRVLDNDARDFLTSLGPHRAASGQEDFLGPARPPSAQDVPSQVVMEEVSEQVLATSAAFVCNAFDRGVMEEESEQL